MPHIIVMANDVTEVPEGAVMLRERITSSDLESAHFGMQLLERLTWAVGDAHAVEEALETDQVDSLETTLVIRRRRPITGGSGPSRPAAREADEDLAPTV